MLEIHVAMFVELLVIQQKTQAGLNSHDLISIYHPNEASDTLGEIYDRLDILLPDTDSARNA